MPTLEVGSRFQAPFQAYLSGPEMDLETFSRGTCDDRSPCRTMVRPLIAPQMSLAGHSRDLKNI